MALIKHYQPYTRLDHYDLDGLLRALNETINTKGEAGEADTPYYVGAALAISIIRYHEFVDTQADFMRLFEKQFNDLNKE